MISKETFRFLQQLSLNNDKVWFDANRSLYAHLRKEFEDFLEIVITEISQFDREAAQTTAKASIFRINRDIRFSNDKLPYKTNFGAFIAKGGRKGIMRLCSFAVMQTIIPGNLKGKNLTTGLHTVNHGGTLF